MPRQARHLGILLAWLSQATMLRVFVDDCLEKVMRGELTPDIAAMAKLLGSEMQGKLLDEILQLHGGYGFMSEYKISRAGRCPCRSDSWRHFGNHERNYRSYALKCVVA